MLLYSYGTSLGHSNLGHLGNGIPQVLYIVGDVCPMGNDAGIMVRAWSAHGVHREDP